MLKLTLGKTLALNDVLHVPNQWQSQDSSSMGARLSNISFTNFLNLGFNSII